MKNTLDGNAAKYAFGKPPAKQRSKMPLSVLSLTNRQNLRLCPYNKHILGIKNNPTPVEEYKEFLLFTEELTPC